MKYLSFTCFAYSPLKSTQSNPTIHDPFNSLPTTRQGQWPEGPWREWGGYMRFTLQDVLCLLSCTASCISGQWSANRYFFTANRNRNRFAEPSSVWIGIGKICEFQNLQIGIGIIFVRWEVFANNSWIPNIYYFFSLKKMSKRKFFLGSYIFFIWKFTGPTKP